MQSLDIVHNNTVWLNMISNLIKRQSERDFLQGSMRNELIDGTKYQSSEQKGNLFRVLCIAHTTNGSHVITRSLNILMQNGSNTSNSSSYISVWKSGFMIQIKNLK
jgi:hypothetical protein